MKINDASRSSGLSRDMIRYYEKIGLIFPSRLPNGYRDYSDDDLYLLTVIKYLSNLGVPLKHISTSGNGGQPPARSGVIGPSPPSALVVSITRPLLWSDTETPPPMWQTIAVVSAALRPGGFK